MTLLSPGTHAVRPEVRSQIREHITWLDRCLAELDRELGQREPPVM
jgi:hypothetical protein